MHAFIWSGKAPRVIRLHEHIQGTGSSGPVNPNSLANFNSHLVLSSSHLAHVPVTLNLSDLLAGAQSFAPVHLQVDPCILEVEHASEPSEGRTPIASPAHDVDPEWWREFILAGMEREREGAQSIVAVSGF